MPVRAVDKSSVAPAPCEPKPEKSDAVATGTGSAADLRHAQWLAARWACPGGPESFSQGQLDTYSRGGDPLSLGAGSPQPTSLLRPELGMPDIDQAMAAAKKERGDALKDLDTPARGGSRALPEDGSYVPSVLHLATDPGSADVEHQIELVRQMAQIGLTEHFSIALTTNSRIAAQIKQALRPVEVANIRFLEVPDEVSDPFVEDIGEFDAAGGVHMPTVLPLGGDTFIHDAISADRKGRFCSKDGAACAPDPSFGLLGTVQTKLHQRGMGAIASAEGRPLHEDLTYSEGGNQLVGTLPNGEGYAVVGKDTLAASKAILERELGRALSQEEVVNALARDLGVKPENVFPVEQPGEFHIDMAMAVIGNGQVLLNDARKAAELQERWLRDDVEETVRSVQEHGDAFFNEAAERQEAEAVIARLHQVAEKMAQYEEKTLKDLQGTPLTVHRIAGVFQSGSGPTMNFLNNEAGTSPSGKTFFIALGGDPRAENYFVEQLTKEIPAGIDHFYFLEPQLSEWSLGRFSGLSCQVKGEGKPTGEHTDQTRGGGDLQR
jgi:hypothetical protein